FKFTQDQIENELRWQHSKEFEYQGVMYDVIEVNQQGSLTQYWCWKDVKETVLNQKLRKLTAFALGHNLPFKNQKQQLVSLIKSLFSQKLDQFNLLLFGKNINSYSTYNENLIGESVAPSTPPPQLI